MEYVKKGGSCKNNKIYGIMKLVTETLNKEICTWLYKVQYVIIIRINFSFIPFQRGYLIDHTNIDFHCDSVSCINHL